MALVGARRVLGGIVGVWGRLLGGWWLEWVEIGWIISGWG